MIKALNIEQVELSLKFKSIKTKIVKVKLFQCLKLENKSQIINSLILQNQVIENLKPLIGNIVTSKNQRQCMNKSNKISTQSTSQLLSPILQDQFAQQVLQTYSERISNKIIQALISLLIPLNLLYS